MSKPIRMSMHAKCLDEPSTFTIGRYRERVQKFVRDCCGITHRLMAEVRINETNYWADIITGSLYEKRSGRCLTGDRVIVKSATAAKRKNWNRNAKRFAGFSNLRMDAEQAN